MFDAILSRNLEAYLALAAARLAAWRVRADALTVATFLLTAVAVFDIAHRHFYVALGFLLAARLTDALDGPVARRAGPTPLGLPLSIVLDLLAAGAVTFAFGLAEPDRALAAMFLMLGLLARAATAVVIVSGAMLRIGKSELFIAFAAACLFPDWFSLIAYAVGILCFVVTGMRLATFAVSRAP